MMASLRVLGSLGTISLIIAVNGALGKLQCKDEQGKDVDWVVLYKLPMMKAPDASDIVDEGRSYVFFTSKTTGFDWQLSTKPIGDLNSIPGKILEPLYPPEENLAYIFYNDEHPDGNVSFVGGHTKGVVAFDEDYGFWLVHSVPKYPSAKEYGYPETGHRYGQTFLCISLKTAENADIIGQLLLYNDPSIYAKNMPKWASSRYPNLVAASEKKHVQNPPYFIVKSITSSKNYTFTGFAKYTKFGKDLYADLVAPALRTDLLAETWPNGPGKMNSSCDKAYHVMNIDGLDFQGVVDKKGREVKFSTKHDHAKWATSTHIKADHMRNIVCIGDINRMNSQKKRGGGTVCFQNRPIWKALISLVNKIELCPIGLLGRR